MLKIFEIIEPTISICPFTYSRKSTWEGVKVKTRLKDENLAPETEASLFGGSLVAWFLPEK